MTEPAFEAVAVELAELFGLDVAILLEARALRQAFEDASPHMAASAFVEAITDRGQSLAGSTSPYAVVVARARKVAAAVETRARVEGARADARREAAASAERDRRQLLARLVENGHMTPDEAAAELARSCFVAPELAEVSVR
jgi:hypothetical protein